MNSTLNLLRHLLQGINPPRILCVCFLFLYISDFVSTPIFLSSFFYPKKPENSNLQEMTNLSIQLNKKTIQANSFEEQLFPILISSKISKIEESPFARNPVDLVCVFEIEVHFNNHPSTPSQQIQDIRNLFKHLLPLMTDQDRLAVVLFYNPSYVEYRRDRINVIDSLPITETPSLTTPMTQNWETIILNIGKKVIEEGMTTEKALKAAVKILDPRYETSRTTGVFILPLLRDDREPFDFEVREDRTMEEIELAKENLGLQDKGWIVKTFQSKPKEQNEMFAESLAALRTGVIETKLLLKTEESELLKGVEIQRIDSQYLPSGKWSFEENNRVFSLRSLSLKPEEFFFDLKIPKIPQGLPSSPIEVKVANYQVIFLLEDGSQVVKNVDLNVKILKEGEKIAEEEESKEAVREFYRKWGDDWLLEAARTTIWYQHHLSAKNLLERYKESLDGSIVKDDEVLQNMWKETNTSLYEDVESGIIRDW